MKVQPPTAALAAAGLIGGYAVAVLTGSRPLGGIVLMIFGAACIATWLRRHRLSTVLLLSAVGLVAFGLSHALGLLIGPWPAVLMTAALTSAAYWQLSDSGRMPAEIRRAARP